MSLADVHVVRERVASLTAVVGPALAAGVLMLLSTGAAVTLGTGAWFFAIAALVLLALVTLRPELGIAVFLSTFLVTYPAALAGSGYLTINNVLGLVFLVLLAYKVYATADWWFARSPELILLCFIAVTYWISSWVNGPEERLLELVGSVDRSDAERLYLNRIAFVLFVINFIQTPAHVRLVYGFAIAMMIASVFTGVWGVMSGEGLYGYRASTMQSVIGAAGNPNRVAMFAIISIGSLWYLLQQVRYSLGRALIIVTMFVQVLGVFMAASRSGLLGLLVCMGFILLDEGFSPRKVIGLALGSLVAFMLVLQFVPAKSLERAQTLPGTEAASTGVGSGSLDRRLYSFGVGFEIVKENFLLGVGIGNWEIARFMHDPARVTVPPHSSYLLAMAEGGIFCLLAFLAVFWRTWRNLSETLRLLPPASGLRGIDWIVKGARVGFIALLVFSLFADLWQQIVLFLIIGLSVTIRRYAQQSAVAMA